MEEKRRCQATTKTGARCKNITTGEYCHIHRKPGGQPGNTNAVKTHEHSQISYNTMTEEEQSFLDNMDTDIYSIIDENIKILTIREIRILRSIQKLENSDGLMLDRVKTTESSQGESKETLRSNTLDKIISLEEALTRVTRAKARYISLKNDIYQDSEFKEIEDTSWLREIVLGGKGD